MKKIILGLSLVLISGSLNIASAHQNGCHRWHSCPSDTGSYVCGDLGYSNFCPKMAENKWQEKKSQPKKNQKNGTKAKKK